jgi:AcrR family transcriptional regulator
MTDETKSDELSGLRADARRNRDRVLKAATGHFASRGVNASLDEIARLAGVGAGTLYRHFPSREALLAAALQDRQTDLRAQARAAREIENADDALSAWLAALQDYLRTFNGLPEPVLSALKDRSSPLALPCDVLVQITREFLDRAQQHGRARPSVTANELFLSTLGVAWVLGRTGTDGAAAQGLNRILSDGYRT